MVSGECLGEDLAVCAPYAFRAHTTLDGKGGFRITMHWRPLKESLAVGVVSGNWFGNQPGPNFFENWNLMYVVNEDGEILLTKKEMLSMECHAN